MAFATESARLSRGEHIGGGPYSPPLRRVPADDAPSFSPVYWRDHDVSYISGISQKGLLSRAARARQGAPSYGERASDDLLFPSSAVRGTREPGAAAAASGADHCKRRGLLRSLRQWIWPSSPPLSSDQFASFHIVSPYAPQSFLEKVLAFLHLVDTGSQQSRRTLSDIRKLSTSELLSLMQLALSAGERERSSFIARELSSRRVAVSIAPQQQQPLPPPVGDGVGRAVPASPLPQQPGGEGWEGRRLRPNPLGGAGEPYTVNVNGNGNARGASGFTAARPSPFLPSPGVDHARQFGVDAHRAAEGFFAPPQGGVRTRSGLETLERSGFAELNTSRFGDPLPHNPFYASREGRSVGRSTDSSHAPERSGAAYNEWSERSHRGPSEESTQIFADRLGQQQQQRWGSRPPAWDGGGGVLYR